MSASGSAQSFFNKSGNFAMFEPGFIARQPVHEATTHGLVFEIHVSQRPAVCIFDNEAFAVLNNMPGRGKPTGFGRLSHQSTYFLKSSFMPDASLAQKEIARQGKPDGPIH